MRALQKAADDIKIASKNLDALELARAAQRYSLARHQIFSDNIRIALSKNFVEVALMVEELFPKEEIVLRPGHGTKKGPDLKRTLEAAMDAAGKRKRKGK